MCDVSASYFSKLFKKVTGENLIEHLNRLRIERGKNELLTTNKSVQTIAKENRLKTSVFRPSSIFPFSNHFHKICKAFCQCLPRG